MMHASPVVTLFVAAVARPARRAGGRCRLRRRARHAGAGLDSCEHAVCCKSVARAGESACCGRPARPRRRFDGRRQDLEAVDDPRQLGSDGRVLRRRQGWLGGRPRWRRPPYGNGGEIVAAAARRSQGERPAAWRDGAKVTAEPASESAKALLAEAQRYKEQGADKPFLDVWFADPRNGYVVGAYNLIFRTADGGKTWEPWFDRTDNPKFFNLYSIRHAAGDVYIAGEAGLVLKLDTTAQRFKALAVPYKGSFFGSRRRGQRRARLRSARQRLAQRQRRHRVDQGRGRSSGGDRRRDVARATARSCWPTPVAGSPRAATAGAPFFNCGQAIDAGHRLR